MQKPVFISFIIPYHNEPTAWLLACVKSLLALEIEADEREIIVIDDGSDASPEETISSIGNNIKYIRQENGGQGEARNRGLKECQGEYVQFVDADDCLIPSAYNGVLHLLREEPPDMIVFGHTSEMGYKGGNGSFFTTSGAEYMLRRNIKSPVWGYIFRRKIADGISLPTGTLTEDEEFTPLLMLQAKTLVAVDTKAYYYRRRPDSLTTTADIEKKEKRLDDSLRSIERLKDEAKRLDGTKKLALTRRVDQITMDYVFNTIALFRDKNTIEAKIKELKNLGLWPLKLHFYTFKYIAFAIISRCSMGRMAIKKIIKSREK